MSIVVVAKSGIVDSLLAWAEFKEQKDLKKTDGKKGRVTGIPKLEDANKAGGSQSQKCTLILTEGDSAKSLAVSSILLTWICDSWYFICMNSDNLVHI